jgi:thiol-disulfide isomerase/thioredoxin
VYILSSYISKKYFMSGEQFASLLGPTLIDPSGKSVDTKTALSNKSVVGLYFSAHWCPPCRQFTPMLSEKYRTSYRGKGMEVVFVSSDRDEKSFKEYAGSMPWLALPFSARGLKESLSSKFGVRGIPMLVILDGRNLSVITTDGREQVMNDANGSKFFGVKVEPSFGGQGVALGGSAGGVRPTAQPAAGAQAVVVDRSKPVTTIQVRFPDGTKVSQEFNSTASCKDVLSFASKSLGSTGGKQIRLAAGFPPTSIADLDQTVVAAGIANAQVIVQLV